MFTENVYLHLAPQFRISYVNFDATMKFQVNILLQFCTLAQRDTFLFLFFRYMVD